LKENILDVVDKILTEVIALYTSDNLSPQEWDIAELLSSLRLKFGLELDTSILERKGKAELREYLYQRIVEAYEEKEKSVGQEMMRHLERMVFLQIIDTKWKDHLYAMDNLREGIGLRAYGQRDPLIEYKREAFEMFGQMVNSIEEEAVEAVFRIQAAKPEKFRGVFTSLSQELLHPEGERFEKPQENPLVMRDPRMGPANVVTPPAKPSQPKVGRNDPCPCGSGKKYKKCCGR
jgi:preprotein translocase subunit SecA